jgi:UDP:flavonoid glycosyltransferase YjiC (YdhE family)
MFIIGDFRSRKETSLHITIIASGSRGDVQPYLALGKGLQDAGHTVRLVTHENYQDFVTSHGVELWPVAGNVQAVAQSADMQALLEKGNIVAILSKMGKEAEKGGLALAEGALAACEGTDLVVAGFGGLFTGIALTEKLGLPLVQAHYIPFTPTRAYPSFILPSKPSFFGNSLNRLSHHLARQMMWQMFRSADRVARKQVFDLPPAPFRGPFGADCLQKMPILYGYSPSVIPKPPDWNEDIHVTGYWFLDSEKEWTPPEGLVEFLESGPPPVYVGFGSMSSRNPEETADLIFNALAQSGQRAVILSGWGGLKAVNVPDTAFLVDSVPFSWLFRRVAAVVHHGGAGTTSAGLRAGVPSIIIPFFGDQPFWGRRVAELGVGPEPIPRRKLTAGRLAQALQTAVTDQGMRQRAARLGARIQAEDGIARAIDIVQEMNGK